MKYQNRRQFLKVTVSVTALFSTNILLGKNAAPSIASNFGEKENAPADTMRCEFIRSPLGIDDLQPSLSWTVNDKRRDVKQTAYRVLVASSPSLLAKGRGDLWDSGKVKSPECNLVQYKGKALQSRQQCYWKVEVTAIAEGKELTGWSSQQAWEMGLLLSEDWKGTWIQSPVCKPQTGDANLHWTRMTLIPPHLNFFKNDLEKAKAAYKRGEEMVGNIYPAPVFKTTFKVSGSVKKARLYISGIGFNEAFVNGKKVSNNMHDPSVTHYPARTGYITHDITSLLQQGENIFTTTVASGWFHEALVWGNPEKVFGDPSLMAQVEIELANGTKTIYATNKDWDTAIGPIIKSDYYAGEIYDARKDVLNGVNVTWTKAIEAKPAVGKLTAQKCEPERIIKRVKPVAVTQPKPGIYVFDLGELVVGTIEMKVKEQVGTPIIIRTAEVAWGMKNQGKNFKAELLHYDDFENNLFTHGMIASKGRGGAYFAYSFKFPGLEKPFTYHLGCPTMMYIANGKATGETYRPSFTIHAFRYIEVQGLKSKSSLDNIEGLVITNDSDEVGSFTCSNKNFNDIFEASINSTRFNTHGMTWDNCVERLQSQVYNAWSAPFISYLLHSPNLWKKILEDQRLQNSIKPKAEKFTGTVYGKRTAAGPVMYPVTQGVTVELPMELYTRYGDKKELDNHYPHMKAWCQAMFPAGDAIITDIATMAAWNDHFYIEASNDCEWRPELNQKAFMTIMMFKNIMDTAKVARLLSKPDDAVELEALAAKIKTYANSTWYNATNKTYGAALNKKTKAIDDSTGWHGIMALAISNDVAPKEDVPMLVANCIKDMKEKYNSHHAAGHITHQLLYDVYSENDLIETCYDMMNSTSYPGFRWMLAQSGSKTISEGPTPADILPSKNTVAQNECQEPARWFTQTLSGIYPDFNEPAFKHIILRPMFPSKLSSASLNTTSAYGKIESSWSRKKGMVTWKVVVPANSYATATLPASIEKIRETNTALALAKGCSVVSKLADEVKCRLGSGEYTFTFPAPKNKPSLLKQLS